MNFVFRVDGSLQIGAGHISRCLTLAKALKKRGANCKFICRDHKNSLVKKIKNENFPVVKLVNHKKIKSTQNIKNINLKYRGWIGSSWKKDANQTINALNKEKIDWLIVDHYGIDELWEKKLQPHVKNIMVIDDLANRNHFCNLLLDQNLVANFKTRYNNLLPRHCTTLLGPRFALLQEDYKNLHSIASSRIGPTKHILVYFGSTIQNNLAKLTLSAFLKLNRKDITLDIVISSKSSQKKKIKKFLKKNKHVKIHTDLTSLAPLMLKADLAIGACGVTSWERCCLGLPSIVITMADHQKPIAKELHKQKLINWIGHYNLITNKEIHQALNKHIDQNFKTWSNTCKDITDGKGAEKVASILTLNSKTKLKTRFATLEDKELFFRWANDPLVRANAFNSERISKKTHDKWFSYRLNNPKECIIIVLETMQQVAIGQARFEKKGRKWYINYSLANYARGKKISFNFLKKAIFKFKEKNKIKLIAEVKKNNIASCKVFEKLKFSKSAVKKKINIFKYEL